MSNRRPSVDPEALRRARRLRHEPTKAEQLLWAALRNGRLEGAKFRRQVVFGEYILDFYSAGHRLVVEVDGDSHEHRAEYDAGRDAWLQAQGMRVLRYTNDDVLTELDGVLEGIRRHLAPPAAGWSGTLRPEAPQTTPLPPRERVPRSGG